MPNGAGTTVLREAATQRGAIERCPQGIHRCAMDNGQQAATRRTGRGRIVGIELMPAVVASSHAEVPHRLMRKEEEVTHEHSWVMGRCRRGDETMFDSSPARFACPHLNGRA